MASSSVLWSDASGEATRIFVTVGTDHHRFDRLLGWIDGWFEARAPADVAVFCQTGSSGPTRRVPSMPFLDADVLQTSLAEADCVVTHGGTTVALARHAGHVPIVVPRSHELGEHVDDHQIHFAAKVAALGYAHLAQSAEELWSFLDRARSDRTAFRREHAGQLRTSPAIRRFEQIVESMLGRAAPYERAQDPDA